MKNAIDEDGRDLRRPRHRGQQRERHQPDADAADRHEALRPDASDQHARHLHRLEIRDPASRESGQPAYPHAVAAARHEGEMVCAASCLFAGEIRHEPLRARACRRTARASGIAVNALWPRTTIATSAIRNLLGGDAIVRASRTPEILADAAYAIFAKPSRSFTGQFLIDDIVPGGRGCTAISTGTASTRPCRSLPDFFVPGRYAAAANHHEAMPGRRRRSAGGRMILCTDRPAPAGRARSLDRCSRASRFPVTRSGSISIEPTREEDRLVEQHLGIEIPTREEMADIEPSEILYRENERALHDGARPVQLGRRERRSSSTCRSS